MRLNFKNYDSIFSIKSSTTQVQAPNPYQYKSKCLAIGLISVWNFSKKSVFGYWAYIDMEIFQKNIVLFFGYWTYISMESFLNVFKCYICMEILAAELFSFSYWTYIGMEMLKNVFIFFG